MSVDPVGHLRRDPNRIHEECGNDPVLFQDWGATVIQGMLGPRTRASFPTGCPERTRPTRYYTGPLPHVIPGKGRTHQISTFSHSSNGERKTFVLPLF